MADSLRITKNITISKRKNLLRQPAIAAMHGPHSDFDICHCTTIHCDAGGVSPVDQ